MSSGTEHIEARLAAYVDGELPEAERAEIEKYLAGNPGHRQMIEVLRGQKALLSSLPRERAPAEILDHLQSHLERQALLENVEEAAGSLRINRWPQWSAIAAMLLLTVGLGALVYSVLPGGAFNREQVAIAPAVMQDLPAAPSLGDADKDSDKDRLARADDHSRRVPGERFAEAALAERTEAAKSSPGGIDEAAGNESRDRKLAPDLEAKPADIAVAALTPEESKKEIEPALPPLNNGSAIVVSTDDPIITQNLLAGYLGQNAYDFRAVRPEAVTLATTGAAVAPGAASSAAATENVMGQNATDLNTGATASQQAIGSVVAKVQQRQATPTPGEQYLVVKNVTPEQAERLNEVLNTQRPMRQQARFFSNAELYPEYRQLQVAGETFAQSNKKDVEVANQNDGQKLGLKQEAPAPTAGAGANLAATVDATLNAPATAPATTPAVAPAAVPATAPATQPLLDSIIAETRTTDVLIVVRNEALASPPPAVPPIEAPPPADAPSTAPSTQPGE